MLNPQLESRSGRSSRALRLASPVLAALLLNVSMAEWSRAQETGVVTGIVMSDEHGEELIGANVYLEGTSRGAASGHDGRFTIADAPAGTHVLVASLLGFATLHLDVTVVAGRVTDVGVIQLAEEAIDLEGILAVADRPFTAASSATLRRFDMLTRPTRSAQDLLTLAPGLITAQHAGGGKAEQIFLRGFDADHGTDVNISVDGVPVNMVSHGHGQGYADLHFIIPEVVDRINVHKGPYATEFGNLSTAGSVAFGTKDHLDENLVRVEGGAFGTASITTLYAIPRGDTREGAYLAGQFYQTDGPFESPQSFRRLNLFGKFHTHLSADARLAVSASGFSAAWDASGQVPAIAVDQGVIDRFGAIDPLEGGTTARQDVNVIYEAGAPGSRFSLQGYATGYDFKLFSNFTLFLEDEEFGDMIEQTDNRTMLGMNGRYRTSHQIGERYGALTIGGGFRSDDVDLSLWRSPGRVRLLPLVDATVREKNLNLWAMEEIVFSSRVRLQVGLRGDYFTFNVNDALEGFQNNLPHASGYAQQAIVSPKANLVVSPTASLDLFANAGTSFHSNDARDVVVGERIRDFSQQMRREGFTSEQIDAQLLALNLDPAQADVGTLPRAFGAEIGFRARPAEALVLSAAAWILDLEEEFVYVGDAGSTELSGRSRRFGVDVESRLRLTSWLFADADVNLSKGYLPDEPENANEIPLAPRMTATGGLTVMRASLEGSLRVVHIGDRPAVEDGSVTADGYTLLNLFAAYRTGPVRLSAVLENLLDVAWNEAQFAYESRLRGGVEPFSGLHFTPGNPRNLRLGLAYVF
ncbi:MAG TPA: TonB-dependent receptor [Rhodothermales bacterium]